MEEKNEDVDQVMSDDSQQLQQQQQQQQPQHQDQLSIEQTQISIPITTPTPTPVVTTVSTSVEQQFSQIKDGNEQQEMLVNVTATTTAETVTAATVVAGSIAEQPGEVLVEDNLEQQIIGRGSFRGRPWNSGGPPPRFRGRGSYGGPMGPGSMRGRGGPGGPGSFFRGRGGPHGGGGGGRFSAPNFDPNWGPQHNTNGPYNQGYGNQTVELWIETKSDDGKSYFYHAITRETTWTKPEGSNIKIMTQAEVEAMNTKNQQGQGMNDNTMFGQSNAYQKDNEMKNDVSTMNQMSNGSSMKKMEPQNTMPPTQQHPPNFFSTAPPHFGTTPFGMPPPGFGGYPPTPWGMSWNMPTTHAMQEQPAKNLIIKPGVIDPAVIARAAEWSEHRAPDGRPYYYHTGRGESVWEKPQAIRDLEAARMAAHSGAAPQLAPIHPTIAPVATSTAPTMLAPAVPLGTTPPFDPTGFAQKQNTTPQKSDAALLEELNDSKEKKRKVDSDKKKKDEEEKNKQANKTQDKSRPISSTPIAGTPWCVVWTGDGRVFFYNPSTRTSVWERPEELLERADVDKAVSNPPEQLLGTVDQNNKTTKDDDFVSSPTEAKTRTESESSVEEVPAKKAKTTAASTVADTKTEQKKQSNDVGKEAAIEAEVRAAKERAVVPLDVRVKSFKEMLREKDVSAFSTWEKELHKIVFDPRYLLLTSRERKQVFEKYVKERAEEERKEKRNKMRQKRDDFRKLMESANLHGRSSFSEFSQKYGRDDRYKGIEKVRERESLFNEFIIEVRRREKEEKIYRKEQIKKDFMEMLRERDDISRHSRWSDIKKKFETDSRYKSVDGSSLREEYFIEFCKILKDEKRRQKDHNKERNDTNSATNITTNNNSGTGGGGGSSSSTKDKKSSKKDKSKKSSSSNNNNTSGSATGGDKERKHSGDNNKDKKSKDDEENGEQTATSDDEAERQQKERDRQMRAEQSIKEREKEVQRTLANHLRDRDKEREHHKRDEAIRHFSALLADLVRNPDLAWKEVKRQLRKDHRWELVENLDREDRERLFNEHIDSLMRKKRDKFREMLDELSGLELTSSWKDIKKKVRDDPRYIKYNNSEKCEREFKDYVKDKTLEAKSALKELLQECKLITHKSYETVQENSNHLKEIEEILRNDKRYLVLDHMSQDRTQIIMTYLEDLHKRGPPPPPTASESTRRK